MFVCAFLSMCLHRYTLKNDSNFMLYKLKNFVDEKTVLNITIIVYILTHHLFYNKNFCHCFPYQIANKNVNDGGTVVKPINSFNYNCMYFMAYFVFVFIYHQQTTASQTLNNSELKRKRYCRKL